MFTVRAALEGLAAADLSTRPGPCGDARPTADGAGCPGAADGSIGDMVEADLAFHRLLCELTGNATLVRAWETLTGPIRVAILFAGPATALANMSAARHQLLLDAIASGDPDSARGAVDAHMRRPPARCSTRRGIHRCDASTHRRARIHGSCQQSTDSAQHDMLD